MYDLGMHFWLEIPGRYIEFPAVTIVAKIRTAGNAFNMAEL